MGNASDDILSDFRLVIEAIERFPAAIAVVDRDGRLVALSHKQEALLGQPREQLIGKPAREVPVLAAIDWDLCLEKASRPAEEELCKESREADTGPAGVRVWPIYDAGDPVGFLVVASGLGAEASVGGSVPAQALIASFPEPIALVDEDVRVRAVSRACLVLNGVDCVTGTSQQCHQVLCNREWPCAECAVRIALAGHGGDLAVSRHQSSTKGATTVAARPVRDASGRVRASVVQLLVEAEKPRVGQAGESAAPPGQPAAAWSCELHQAALQTCGLAVFVVDRSMRPLDHFGHAVPAQLPPADQAEDVLLHLLGREGEAVVRSAVNQGKPLLGRPRPDSPRTVVLPLLSAGGNRCAVVGVAVPKESMERGRVPDRIVQKLSCFADVGAALAHELNNALNAISHRVDCLRIEQTGGIEDKKLKDEVELLKDDVRRITVATQQLLRIASTTREEPAPVDINEVVVRALATSLAGASRCRVVVNRTLQPNLPMIWGWATELERCFRNIIDNAVEAMGGEGRLDVATRWVPGADSVEVSIRDTGEGIRPEHLARVREPFFTTRKYRRALGLGLAAAYDTALRHGGDLVVKSYLHRGTRVTVRLQKVPPGHRCLAVRLRGEETCRPGVRAHRVSAEGKR